MKERVFNYNNHTHHQHFHESTSNYPNPSSLSNSTARRLIGGGRRHQHEKGPISLNNEFNKKIVEKSSTSGGVQANDLPPEAAKYISSAGMNRVAQRPTSAKKDR